MADYIIYTDGGSRGNPGKAAFGVVIQSANSEFHKSYGEYMGIATNNEAEYSGVISGLHTLKNLLGGEAKHKEVEVRADSELLVRQMNGVYKVRNPRISKLFMEVWNAKSQFKAVVFTHIRRAQNKEADAMVNKALDAVEEK